LRFLYGIGPWLAMAVGSPCAAWGQGYPPDIAAQKMSLAAGLEARLIVGEPLVRQPVAIDFDDRGRLWVIQYLQYPNPAGLERVEVDRYSRTRYDRVPKAPPHGPRGADRITILTDTDRDGRMDRAHDFVDGLNLASGFAFGHGGVFVLQAPYLLFYPDRDRDDVPDGDPEVLQSGFGMEDAHSVANSLTWGPDGWLYGTQGSTVTARIRDIEFQQGVWRYHPRSKVFELFYEGGGNTWGLDFDQAGQMFASTNFGPYVLLHGVQGGYYWKSFGKHGALHNPYTFGYFDHVTHQNARGGHVSVGGVIYHGGLLPPQFEGKYIAGNLLSHGVYFHGLSRQGSTFTGRHDGELLESNDTWFATSDVTVGPDGALYVADWHDQRMAHPDPDAQWDRSNGRIYRIAPPDASPDTHAHDPFDLQAETSQQLFDQMDAPNRWIARRARRILMERRDGEIVPMLRRTFAETENPRLALVCLWTLAGMGQGSGPLLSAGLDHDNEDVRYWAVRFCGDQPIRATHDKLKRLASQETSIRVRSQLASTAKRLPPEPGIEIAARLLAHVEDQDDAHLPLLVWWAVEAHCTGSPRNVSLVTGRFATPDMWDSDYAREAVLKRLVQRYAAETDPVREQPAEDRPLEAHSPELAACVKLYEAAEASHFERDWLRAMASGLPAGRYTAVPEEIAPALEHFWSDDPRDILLLTFLARCGDPRALSQAGSIADDADASDALRREAISLLGRFTNHPQRVVPLLLNILDSEKSPALRLAALEALTPFSASGITQQILGRYPDFEASLRHASRDMLFSRPQSAKAFLKQIQRGAIPSDEVPLEQVARLALHEDPALDEAVQSLWGRVQPATPETVLADIRRLNNDLRAFSGDGSMGHKLFVEQCGKCHRLFGEGNTVGPDLTGANRMDRQYLLIHVVDPKRVIRHEYLNYVVQLEDGRVLQGLIAEQTAQSITILDAENKRHELPRDRIEQLQPSDVSLMPEGILQKLSPQQLRDLFAYLQQPATSQ
jgi:putative membrane-bound dehydrogenase-like protein